MKQLLVFAITLIMMIGSNSCNAAQGKKEQAVKAVTTEKVAVYYFHFTRRCITCNAVEAESKKAIEGLYPELIKKGKITFSSINLDEESSKPIANQLGIEGQCLLIINGEAKIDLTSQGFMYARSNPGKLKAEIRKVIDPLIKK